MTNNRDLRRLLNLMAQLRDPQTGCPWDVAQSFATIAPYTIEEAYEVADAIAHDDMAALRDELGDLLFQVVFHARMAEEAGHFAFDDVARGIADKMERRHPHIFCAADAAAPPVAAHARPADAAQQTTRWEALKAQERGATGKDSAMDGIARALPALLRADKIQKRAARTGFDWPDASGARAKIDEELHEFATAADDAHRAEEAGDLLFALVNYLRLSGIDSETALRAANDKFARRFRAMEQLGGDGFHALDLDSKEALWRAVKQAEQHLQNGSKNVPPRPAKSVR